ncbi:MAG: hypothetical protein LBC61_05520 [Candidatus Peribacteria bacterium]|jgi:hypothetical protein|nr:hypothetical protein [Candidatus Peribacteria bacterium]
MESKNLYEIKRTIRFLAESTNNQKSIIDYLKKIENKKSSDKKYDLLLNFLNDFDKILNLIDKVFFYKDS